jgi:hypothetical protein
MNKKNSLHCYFTFFVFFKVSFSSSFSWKMNQVNSSSTLTTVDELEDLGSKIKSYFFQGKFKKTAINV